MISILISNPCDYPIDEVAIIDKLTRFLEGRAKDNCEVSIKITNKVEMLRLARIYLNERNILHNVLSFTYSEAKDFLLDPDGVTRLGDIAVCYEKAKEEAENQGILVDEWLYQLIEHGVEHLLGIHHD